MKILMLHETLTKANSKFKEKIFFYLSFKMILYLFTIKMKDRGLL